MSENTNNRGAQNGAQGNQELMELLVRAVANQNAAQNNQPDRDTDDSFDLIGLFWRIVSKLHYVIISALVCTLLAFIWVNTSYMPSYRATAKLYIVSNSNSVVNLSDLQLGTALTMDYKEVFATWEVSEMVRSALGLDYSYTKLQSMLNVTNPNSSRVLYLTVTSNNPQEAADIANAYADAGRQFIMQSMSSDEPNSFSVALVPSQPSTRSKSTYVIIGFLFGTLLSIAIITLLYLLDDHPRTSEDITKCSGLPTLAVIPVMEHAGSPKKQKKSFQMPKLPKGGKKA